MEKERTYIAIDLKSFYASVECSLRELDPLRTNLVVADASRTEKTICLAVSPSLKAYGIPGRARLFEVLSRVKEVNAERLLKAPGHRFTGKSFDVTELEENKNLELSFIIATPQMRKYMEMSTKIYDVYLKYISPDDIHVYSIDEVFIDATNYLNLYQKTGRGLASMIIREIYYGTGITATGGIGTNLYLAKVAMDIMAKHVDDDENGLRIAELNERTYREKLWTHTPLTDFWRVGHGIQNRLQKYHIYTMGDIARCSIGKRTDFYNEELLYKLFGINAELLIDHAWGYEPVTMDLIKQYKPETNSTSTGQVLPGPYDIKKARIIVHEMTDQLALSLVEKKLKTDQIVLHLGYEKSDHPSHGSINLNGFSSSSKHLIEKTLLLYDQIVRKDEQVRRLSITANHLTLESELEKKPTYEQLSLFTDYEALEKQREEEKEKEKEERSLQEALLNIQKRYGKNAVLKGTNFEEGAMTRERNGQIGGHKA